MQGTQVQESEKQAETQSDLGLPVAAKVLPPTDDEFNRTAEGIAALFACKANGWAVALLQAAVLCHAVKPHGPAKFMTPYGNDFEGPHVDAEKHAQYIACVRASVESAGWSWLWPMLEAAGASVCLDPSGSFLVSLGHIDPRFVWDIGMLTYHVRMTPWVDADEVAH